MLYSNLDELLKKYKNTWYVRKFMYGDHEEIISLTTLLNGKRNEDEVTLQDIFELIKIFKDSRLSIASEINTLINKNNLFKIFQTYDVDFITFQFIYDLSPQQRANLHNLNVKSISQVINLLEIHQLAEAKKFIFIILYTPERLESVLTHLSFSQMLSMQTLKVCLDTSLPQWARICEQLYTAKVKFPNQNALYDLAKLFLSFLHEFEKMVNLLSTQNKLTQNVFNDMITDYCHSLVKPSPATVSKISRKESKEDRSELIINNDTYYIQHLVLKYYPQGSFGKVKALYKNRNDGEPVKALKILKPSLHRMETTCKEEAIKEVQFNQLLQRPASFFTRNNKTYVVMPWIKDAILKHFSRNDLKEISQLGRIHALLTGLKDLEKIHNAYCTHQDVALDNFIFDRTNYTLQLIDFGNTHKQGDTYLYPSKGFYRDPQMKDSENFRYPQDMYAMSIVMAYLFPEAFNVDDVYICTIEVIPSEDSTVQALQNLFHAMRDVDLAKRSTIRQAVNYIEHLYRNSMDKVTVDQNELQSYLEEQSSYDLLRR